MSEKMELYAVPNDRGMAIYLRDRAQRSVYVMCHRKNQDLFHYLRNGRSVRDVRNYRPGRNRAQQKMAKSLAHVLRVAEWAMAEQMSA